MNAADISGRFFLDTNILVYSFDRRVPSKQQVSHRWIRDALRTQRGVISTQVVQEFLNVALRRFAQPLTIPESREYLKTVLMPLCILYPTVSFFDRALLLRQESNFQFYDSLIVTAALDLGCSVLVSEDMQDGLRIGGLTIRNPFTD
jgi:predicted nucleic acid-binding protein